jgi:nitrous oxidase accessory protein NosD
VLLLAAPAWAGTFCVPDASIRDTCPSVAPTLQEAINAATPGSVIYVGPGTPSQRIVIDRRLTIRCINGGEITDEGLAKVFGANVVHMVGTGTPPRPVISTRIEACTIRVTASTAGAVLLEPQQIFTQFKGVSLIADMGGQKPIYGLRAYDNGRYFFIGGPKGTPRPTVSGFGIGIDSKNTGWANVEAGHQGGVLFTENGIGMRSISDKGQLFYNVFDGNEDVGLIIRGNFHQDVNANEFYNNGVGLVWGLSLTPNIWNGCTAQTMMEFNHAIFEGNGISILVDTAPFVNTQDYTQDPGRGTQWQNMTIDGVKVPNHKTTYRDGQCQP